VLIVLTWGRPVTSYSREITGATVISSRCPEAEALFAELY